ncbi:MAG TPA: SpoIIE family protein phosphatase, partial [Steroidobacteraceae bacterium]|nr:SpoIIE family protein phosphatase [Steroidobacteraceae bacterium]
MPPASQSVPTGLRAEALLQILEVTRKLAAPFELPAVLAEIGEAARSVLRAERATVWLYEPDHGVLVLTGTPDHAPPVKAELSRGILGLTARSRQIINVPDVRRERLFDPAVDLDLDDDLHCMLSVPLVERSQLVGVLQVVDREGYDAFTTEDERIAETLATQCVVFIQRERISRSLLQAEKLDREIKLAREIQMSTLPAEMPRLADYDMAGQFCPADQTGGDTFDLVPLDGDRLFLLLGDASGHGIGPALSATQMTGMLRVALRLGADLDAIFAQVNNQLVEDLPEEHFVTAFFGMLDTRTHAVTYHSAGQGPLLHFHAATRECRWLTPTTFPMGFMRYPQIDPPQEVRLEPGDVLGLISDGVFECENPAGDMFGISGVEAVLREHGDESMSDLLARMLQAVHVFAAGRPQADDITIVLLSRRGDTAGRTTVQQYFARSFDSLDAIFRFIGDFLEARSLGAELHGPVCFIVEELFTNFVKYNEGGRHDISLSLGHTPDRLTVRLTDFDVESFDPTHAPAVDVDRPLGDRQPGGLGLHLVRQMADTL